MLFVVLVMLQLMIGQQCLCAAGPQSQYVHIAVVIGKGLGAWSAFHTDFTYVVANVFISNL